MNWLINDDDLILMFESISRLIRHRVATTSIYEMLATKIVVSEYQNINKDTVIVDPINDRQVLTLVGQRKNLIGIEPSYTSYTPEKRGPIEELKLYRWKYFNMSNVGKDLLESGFTKYLISTLPEVQELSKPESHES